MPLRLVVNAALLCSCCTAAHGQVFLRHKVEEGARYAYEISQFVRQVKTNAGKVYKEDCDTGLVQSIQNGQRDAQGQIRQTVKFESLRNNYDIRRDIGNSTLRYDSTTNVAKVDPPGDEFRGMGFFIDVFKTLLGASYNIVIDKNHHVAAVEGAEEIINSAPRRAAQWLDGRAGQVNIERLKATHEQVLRRFPDRALMVGDTWEQKGHVEVHLVGGLTEVERQYEYLGTEERDGRTLDKIRWTDTKIAEKPPIQRRPLPNRPPPAPIERLDQKIVESSGLLYFDRQRGIEVQSNHVLHYRYKLAPDRETDIKIETRQRLKE